ncbi:MULTISPECIES: ABC transporter substrate-binding protein [unclassified Streptomyces]|uniref:ABC transporter substrate-binding protein n=1 Tax=unclassified Streptomyces TaxID=2593676 RepID=UPI0023655AB2|nr:MULTISPECIES: ABC transporter substrate-binding protein [unclassified Streptomyces]MDF3147356.1 ABC transporter substrate-binding protein [Streptomyces sp. T21Q-yed]WDF35428.1 ABC transporter substrate-binding protein [Streptomyces sp. T12]
MKLSKKKKLGAAVATGVVLAAVATTAIAQTTRPATVSEQDQLQALYRAAKAEGGKVTVYMGGDAPGQWDALSAAFAQQFPDVKLHLVTDLSKYHDARIDNQLAAGHLVADAAILQTTQDFDRWKKHGDLLKYKPVGWDKVFTNAKDKDGYYTGVFYGAFSYVVNTKQLPANAGDFKGTDLLKPEYKNKLILTYPNDDDAVLFGYKQIVDEYGWDYLAHLVEQNPKLIRGVPGSAAGVASGDYLAAVAVGGDARPSGTQVFSDSERFNSWAQRGAIFKQAPHKAGAKLFMSWLNSQSTQEHAIATWTWSVRKDVAPPTGLKPLASYRNTDPKAFAKFMSNRAAVERFRSQVELYFGQVKGTDPGDPKGTLGRTPGAF